MSRGILYIIWNCPLRSSALVPVLARIALCLIAPGAVAQHIAGGKLVFPERRLTAYIFEGANREVMSVVKARIHDVNGDGPGSWVYEWRQTADYYLAQGEHAQTAGRRDQAFTAYHTASVYYSLAAFPEYYTKAERAAFRQHLMAYKKAGALLEPPLEVVPVKIKGHTIDTYLHRPPGNSRPPLVLWTGGIDQYKGNSYYHLKPLLDRGFAVVTFDIAGTGENTFWHLSPDGEFVHQAVLDYFSRRPDIDTVNIFEVGRSFGGYYAVKMAARNDPRLRAVAAECTPVHAAFVRPVDTFEKLLASPEGRTLYGMARRMGIKPGDAKALANENRKFSLINQGLLGKGRTIKTPLLIIDGGRDRLVPQSDMQLLAASALESEVWTLGMDGHCYANYAGVVAAQVAEWFLQHIAK
ncbi:MAG: alpha/beta fold hydrolase [Gammaproteobacteria bacterium]